MSKISARAAKVALAAASVAVSTVGLCAPSDAAPAAAHKVSLTKLCNRFGTNAMYCHGDYAEQNDRYVKYAARGTTPAGVTSEVLMTGRTSCNALTFQFWGDKKTTKSSVAILTVNGTYRASSKTDHVATIRANLGHGPFKISLAQTGPDGGRGFIYINGSASCANTTG